MAAAEGFADAVEHLVDDRLGLRVREIRARHNRVDQLRLVRRGYPWPCGRWSSRSASTAIGGPARAGSTVSRPVPTSL
jgi:hypothetical protein